MIDKAVTKAIAGVQVHTAALDVFNGLRVFKEHDLLTANECLEIIKKIDMAILNGLEKKEEGK